MKQGECEQAGNASEQKKCRTKRASRKRGTQDREGFETNEVGTSYCSGLTCVCDVEDAE
jgi:hypothetical protein